MMQYDVPQDECLHETLEHTWSILEGPYLDTQEYPKNLKGHTL